MENGFTGGYDSVKRFVRRLAGAARFLFGGWSALPGKRPRSISAPARRSSGRTGSVARRTCFASS